MDNDSGDEGPAPPMPSGAPPNIGPSMPSMAPPGMPPMGGMPMRGPPMGMGQMGGPPMGPGGPMGEFTENCTELVYVLLDRGSG